MSIEGNCTYWNFAHVRTHTFAACRVYKDAAKCVPAVKRCQGVGMRAARQQRFGLQRSTGEAAGCEMPPPARAVRSPVESVVRVDGAVGQHRRIVASCAKPRRGASRPVRVEQPPSSCHILNGAGQLVTSSHSRWSHPGTLISAQARRAHIVSFSVSQALSISSEYSLVSLSSRRYSATLERGGRDSSSRATRMRARNSPRAASLFLMVVTNFSKSSCVILRASVGSPL